jgi:activator of HSP90 ATPase
MTDTTASAWNAAGTWEEKNVSGWVTERLTQRLSEAACDFAGGSLRVASVQACDGDASVAFVRGSKRYIYNFAEVELVWEAAIDGDTINGSLMLPDVASDCNGKFEFEPSIPSGAHRAALKKQLDSEGGALQVAITAQIALFEKDFHEAY